MTTPFIKELFDYHGGYLMYRGKHDLSRKFEEDYPVEQLHPSNVGRYQDTFIARFKYGQRPWKKWVTFLCKNCTCEEWVELNKTMTPLAAIESLGYYDDTTVRVLRGRVKWQEERIQELTKQLEEAKK